jgi:uncharacterized protein (DUF2384 family)
MKLARDASAEMEKAAALTKEAIEAARRLGLTPTETANVLVVPQGAFAAMKKGERAVDGLNGEAERADALVRIVKRLGVLLGDSETAWRSWLRRDNDPLDDRPIDVFTQRDGVLKVANYLASASKL